MRIAVNLVLDVDREAWDRAYGTGGSAAAVRADVLRYVLTLVQGSAATTEDVAITAARLAMPTGRVMPSA